MSLQVWLPLTRDLRQQGLSIGSITSNNASFDTNGKLGGCYIFNGVDNAIGVGNLSTMTTTDFTFTCWFYHDDTWSSKSWETIFGGPSGFELQAKNSTTNSPVIYLYSWGKGNFTYELNKWNHLAMVRTASETKIYLNGELKITGSAGSIPNGNYFVGSWRDATSQNFKGKMCDVRIYDNALSSQEVKEISKGLILHYPLNRHGWGQENLAKNSNLGWNSTTYNIIQGEMYEDWVVGDTYTITIKGTPSSGCKFGLWSDTGNANMCYFNNKIGDDIWITTATCSASRNTAKFSVWDYPSTNPTHNAHIDWIKIERGSKATPWSPAPSDTLADTMSLNGITEYDCSGFGNNGTWHGTHTNTSDTPKYAVSTTATGSASTYLEGPILPANVQTAALWIRCKKSQNAAIFNDKTSGLQIGLLNSLLYMNSKASTAGFTTTHWKDDNWNHVVVTYDGTTRKAYINGEAETQSGASNYYIHNADNCWLWNRSYNNSYPFNGSLSDFRIYATALSADDVKSLYQNEAAFDDQGNILGPIR